MKEKTKKAVNLTVQEALDNLALIAGINPEDPYRIGIVKDIKFVKEGEGDISLRNISIVTPDGSDEVFQIVQKTYTTLLHYLEELYDNPETDWDDPKTRDGLQAMMDLVGESAIKLDKVMAIIEPQMKPHSISYSKEYQDIQNYYLHKIQKKFTYPLEGNEEWGEEWDKEGISVDPKEGLKDFETIKTDREYELFYITNEDGKLFFSPHLLRNIKLFCEFDVAGTLPFEEDPLLRLRSMQDRDLSAAAIQILMGAKNIIGEFYRQKIRLKDMEIIRAVLKASMALMLASNQRNLIQNTQNKSCLEYFQDFEKFLTEALNSPEYQKWIAYPPDPKDKTAYLLMDYVNVLCKHHFLRSSGIKQEMDGFIHRLMRKGEELLKKETKIPKTVNFWQKLSSDDESLRHLLKCYPSGPLFKILDLLRNEEEERAGFEPLKQGNDPHTLFQISYVQRDIAFLHLPAPTMQKVISKAEVSDYFKGFLRSYQVHRPMLKHLFINLQDRTSWKEHIRSQVLESLQKQAEFSGCLTVISLNKDTDFYHQKGPYLEVNKAEDFMKQLEEQMTSPEDFGFYIPPHLKNDAFTKELNSKIHEHFFQKAKTLTRPQRLDFIEIFYHFFLLKMIELVQPDSISFSCKDGIDTGACLSASFYGFLHYLANRKLGKAEEEYLRILFYLPALLIRERGVDPERINRILSVQKLLQESFEEEGKKILKSFAPLYDSLGKNLAIHENPGQE
ncbi:MAG TPA: hypothetical protein VLG44_02445 [Chlamydiales bacterium]|nr:hypothetical protein [Chlamydiales bacterium]